MQVVNIPYGKGSLGKNSSTNLAPEQIKKTVKEIFLSEQQRIPVFSFHDIVVDESDMEAALPQIETQARKILSQSTQPVCFVGGDHSITYATFQAFVKEKCGIEKDQTASAGLIVVDAHPDLMQSFDPPTHENYLRCMIENNMIHPEKIILIGIRAWDQEEADFIKKHKIKSFSMAEIQREGFNETVLAVMSAAREWKAAYFSIDIDGVDPAFAPGTGYAEPGGLTSRELIHLIHQLKRLPNIKCYDVVEINPEKDVNNMTVKLGAKILAELC